MNNVDREAYNADLFEKELQAHKRKIARAMMGYEKWLDDNDMTKDDILDDVTHIYKCREVIIRRKLNDTNNFLC